AFCSSLHRMPYASGHLEIFARRLAEDCERYVASRKFEASRARCHCCLHSGRARATMTSILYRHFVGAGCALVLFSSAFAQQNASPNVVVTGENESEHDQFTEPGEYAQPAWAERSRLSSTTSVYVLSPYEMFIGNIWEGDFPRRGKSADDFVQEIDVGLLHRFELGLENELGLIGGEAHETAATFEARYAFASWNALLLNPAISLEYIFGVGKSVKTLHRQPNALAV